jgi:hypothetical protein
MNRLKYVRFRIPEKGLESTRSLLEKLGLAVPSSFENEGSDLLATSHSLLARETQADMLVKELVRLGIDPQPFCRSEREYSREELEEAGLFWAQIKAQNGDGFTVFGGEYDFSRVCRRCKSGARQAGPLVVESSAFKGPCIASTYNFEIVLSIDLAQALSGLEGFRLGEVFDYRAGSKVENLRQLVPTRVLPKMVPPTRFRKSSQYCRQCDSSGLYLDSEVHLSEIPEPAADFFRSNEIFGEVRDRSCPGGELVISFRAAEIIRCFDKQALDLEPVFHEGKVVPRQQ